MVIDKIQVVKVLALSWDRAHQDYFIPMYEFYVRYSFQCLHINFDKPWSIFKRNYKHHIGFILTSLAVPDWVWHYWSVVSRSSCFASSYCLGYEFREINFQVCSYYAFQHPLFHVTIAFTQTLVSFWLHILPFHRCFCTCHFLPRIPRVLPLVTLSPQHQLDSGGGFPW